MDTTTQNRSSQYISPSIETETFKQNFKTYLVGPLSAGLIGFVVLFSIIMLTKVFGYILGTHAGITFQITDVIYSLTGFLFGAGAKFVEFFGKED